MSQKKPAPVLEMLFDGPGILPEKIPIGTLSKALSAVQRLASGRFVDCDDEDNDEKDQLIDDSLRLLSIRRGSAVFVITGPAPDVPLGHIRQAGKILEHPDESDDTEYIINPIEDLSRIAGNLECELTLRKPDSSRPLLKVDGDSFRRIAGKLIIEGDTSFTAKVERVGGKLRNRCALSVSFQPRMVYCSVATPDLARKLGERLYQDVAVQGAAKWLRGSWRLFSFTVKEVYQPRTGSILEAFQALREAGGKAWDSIDDPSAFIREVSGDR